MWSFALTSAFDNITHSRCIVNLLQQRAYVEAPNEAKELCAILLRYKCREYNDVGEVMVRCWVKDSPTRD